MVGRPAVEKHWKDLAALLLAHPDWAKGQVANTMRRAGMKYGEDSKDDVIQVIDVSLRKLAPFLGKLSIDSIDYAPQHLTETNELLPPAWIVNAHPSEQDTAKPITTYVLTFSAFDGVFQSEQKFISGHHKSNDLSPGSPAVNSPAAP
jgi:hypothetical protein